MHASSQCRYRSDGTLPRISAKDPGELPIHLAPLRQPMEARVDRVRTSVGGRMRIPSPIAVTLGAAIVVLASASTAQAKNDDLYDRRISEMRFASSSPPPPRATELSARRDGIG